jgi:hypothetical protein
MNSQLRASRFGAMHQFTPNASAAFCLLSLALLLPGCAPVDQTAGDVHGLGLHRNWRRRR